LQLNSAEHTLKLTLTVSKRQNKIVIDNTKEQKSVTLTPIDEFTLSQFTLETVAGRDALAEQILKDIDEYCQKAYDDGPRSHLGASLIGNECEFYLWAEFRWMKREIFSGRMQRLFNRGHLEEERIIEWLTAIGFEVKQTEVDGKQIRIAACEGHFGGSCDGNGELPKRYLRKELESYAPILLEFKTSNDKAFPEVENMGVIKAKPVHYKQMCTYGCKLGIQYALYIMINKNNDALNIELIELDWEIGEAEIQKAEKVIFAIIPPPKIAGHGPTYWKCKWCYKNGICHMDHPIDKNCRSCQFAQPVANAQWHCHQWNAIIPAEAIVNGCDAWKGLGI
jgi:hypothetical protein